MAATTSPAPEERTNKRLKQDDGPAPGPQPMPPQPQRYPPPQHYGGGPPPPPGPPHMAPGGYYGGPPPGPPPQYGNHGPPPPHWQGGPHPPPGPPPPGRYPQGPPPPPRGLSPDRMGGGPPPWQQHGGYRDSSPPKGQKPKLKPDKGDNSDPYYSQGPPPPYPGPPQPPPGYGPPPHWQGGPPPPPMYASQGTWTGKSPPRTRHRDPYRQHEMELPPYMSRGQQSVDDDGGSSVDGSNKEKGRGSYKCGRCGVPKKGHVCPYQPKMKRRPDEPPPQTRSAAVQVEMDEFMTLRRLNIRIQGFPESYATEPFMTAETTMLVGEPLHHPIVAAPPPPPVPPEMTSRMHPAEQLGSGGSMPIAEPAESRDTGVGEGSLLDDDDVDTT